MKMVELAQAFIGRSRELEVVENTYIPDRAGLRLQVEKVGKSYYDGRQLNGKHVMKPFRGTIPTRACDVVSVDSDTAKFCLGDSDRLRGHTVTLRRLS